MLARFEGTSGKPEIRYCAVLWEMDESKMLFEPEA
jgi:hypothetical protein